MMMRRVVLFGAVVIGVAPSVRADDVTLVPGATIKGAIGGRLVKGQVLSESPSEVVVKLGTTTTAVTVDQILSIRYDGQPATIQLAETREAAGQLAEAAELYRKAAGEAAGKPFVQQMALYHEAAALTDLALADPERTKEARDKVTRFVQTYPSSRHIVAAREDLAKLQVHAGDFKAAETNIGEMARLPGATQRAAVLRARLLARRGSHAEAVSELDRLISAFPDRSVQQREARLAKAESLVGLKKFKEAEGLVREVIQAAPAEDAPAQAAAYNTLGDCLRAAERPKDALLAYLHTDLLYAKDKEEHPRALYQIEKLFRQLKQDGRADEYAQRLRQEYPRSPWLSAKAPEH
jgi:tetratricopeptide (TPR) repeat protein